MVVQQKYDSSSSDSILSFARELVGCSLSDFVTFTDSSVAREVKGKFGQFLEKYYFGLNNNSDSLPDFVDAGVELKSTPVRRLSNGKFSAKERVVLNIIDYVNVINEEWDSSHFLSKNELILFVMYLYEEDKSFLDFLIKFVTLWKLEGEDREIIRQDWEKIVSKIRAGKAHELSESDTFYLGACRKGWKEQPRIQPNSTIRAPQRAFSFKTKYMNAIIRRLDNASPVVKSLNELKVKSFEEIVYDKLKPFIGLTVTDIEKELGVSLNSSAKGYYAALANRMMGVQTKNVEEFEKADVQMKIIRLKHNGVPKEDMSFPYFKYKEVASQDWHDSAFYEQLDKKFFFVVYEMNNDETKIVFKKAFFWNIPFNDLIQARNVWEETKKRINQGNADSLPKKSENRVSHVRPHARNAQDTDTTPQGKEVVKKCFWLNAKYLKEQIDNENS